MTRILIGASLEGAVPGMCVEVTGAELHYLKNVRRHGVGDPVRVVDGNGNSFVAIVAAIDSAAASLTLKEAVTDEAVPVSVHILAAVPKEKILDDVVRKLSELGVDRLTPLICERSSVVPGEQRLERWRRIAVQSMRQCRRSRVLEIAAPVSFSVGLGEVDAPNRFVLHPSGETGLGTLLKCRKSGEIAFVIGPEGGFSDAELNVSTANLFQAVQLGKSILRMETAMLVAAVAGVTMTGGYDG